MTFTSHGHHIPGSVHSGAHPLVVASCGGVPLCKKCKDEAAAYPYDKTEEKPTQGKLPTTTVPLVMHKNGDRNVIGEAILVIWPGEEMVVAEIVEVEAVFTAPTTPPPAFSNKFDKYVKRGLND